MSPKRIQYKIAPKNNSPRLQQNNYVEYHYFSMTSFSFVRELYFKMRRTYLLKICDVTLEYLYRDVGLRDGW